MSRFTEQTAPDARPHYFQPNDSFRDQVCPECVAFHDRQDLSV